MNNPCNNMAKKSQVLLRETIKETKIFFHKTLLNLKSSPLFAYGNLPKLPIIKPSFSRTNKNQKITDEPKRVPKKPGSLVHESPAMHGIQGKPGPIFTILPSRMPKNGDTESIKSIAEQVGAKIVKEKRSKEENTKTKSQLEAIRRQNSSKSLARKLNELEMMNANDVDHVLDIEEVLYHYSSITSPVYLEIVDNFFMDMYHEYSLPQPTLSVNSSMRCNSSMRRLGPLKL